MDTRVINYALLDSVPVLRRPYLLSDYEDVAATNNIHQSVCVEAASAGTDGWKETLWLLEHIMQSRVVQRLVAWAPIEQPDIGDYLEKLAQIGGDAVVGVRRSFEFEVSESQSNRKSSLVRS
jgi:predicted TIM-barrel fold metal-dependent hydrolase